MREEELAQMRETIAVEDHLCVFWVLLLALMLILSMRKLCVFLLYGLPEENSLCILSFLFIVVHVILQDKILDHIN